MTQVFRVERRAGGIAHLVVDHSARKLNVLALCSALNSLTMDAGTDRGRASTNVFESSKTPASCTAENSAPRSRGGS